MKIFTRWINAFAGEGMETKQEEKTAKMKKKKFFQKNILIVTFI